MLRGTGENHFPAVCARDAAKVSVGKWGGSIHAWRITDRLADWSIFKRERSGLDGWGRL